MLPRGGGGNLKNVYFSKDGNFKDIIENTLHKSVSNFTASNFMAVVTGISRHYFEVANWGHYNAENIPLTYNATNGTIALTNPHTVTGTQQYTHSSYPTGKGYVMLNIIGYLFDPDGTLSA